MFCSDGTGNTRRESQVLRLRISSFLTPKAEADASPSFVEAFRHNLPGVPVAHESVQDSLFFNRMFDGVVAWGLIFLLLPEDQRRLIQRVANILVPGGRFLFTSSPEVEPLVWNDAMTGLESRSLGAAEYRKATQVVPSTDP